MALVAVLIAAPSAQAGTLTAAGYSDEAGATDKLSFTMVESHSGYYAIGLITGAATASPPCEVKPSTGQPGFYDVDASCPSVCNGPAACTQQLLPYPGAFAIKLGEGDDQGVASSQYFAQLNGDPACVSSTECPLALAMHGEGGNDDLILSRAENFQSVLVTGGPGDDAVHENGTEPEPVGGLPRGHTAIDTGPGNDYIVAEVGLVVDTITCGDGIDSVAKAGPEDIVGSDCESVNGTAPSPAPSIESPVAMCDTYWVKPHGSLDVPAPGFLGNDFDPGGLSITAKVVQTNFAAKDHPYSYNGTTGALRFKPESTPGGKPFVAVINYVLRNSSGRSSNQATIKIYIQPTKPSPSLLKGCGSGKDEDAEPDDHQKKSKCGPTDFDISWRSARTATLNATCVKKGYGYEWGDRSGCPKKLAHPSANPPNHQITLPAISHEKVSLCAIKGKEIVGTKVDAMSPVYRYAPYVYLAKGERYFPGKASTFIQDSALVVDKPDSTSPDVRTGTSCKDEELASRGNVDAYRLAGKRVPYTTRAYNQKLDLSSNSLKCVFNGSVIGTDDAPASVAKSKGRPTATGFKLVLKDKGDYDGNLDGAPVYAVFSPGQYISYWFFYDYNGWRQLGLTELHEGDWEHMRVKLDDHNKATGVEYFQHYCAGEPFLWGKGMAIHKAADGREQPVVFSALGGHASYATEKHHGIACVQVKGLVPQPQGFDVASKGRAWDTSDRIADAKGQAWWGYGGSWGDYVDSNFGNFGPPSPGPHNLY